MKPSLLLASLCVAATIAVQLCNLAATAEPGQDANGSTATVQTYPPPTNLKVLPKNLTGAQVREIMHEWEEELGTDCSTCHVRDPRDLGPNGKPRFNYADDSKPEKATSRVMYTMLEDDNANYIGKIENSGVPITCGTCHRGRIAPEPFTSGSDDNGGSVAGHATPNQ